MRSSRGLGCVDGLNDYDDDYLTGSTGQGVIKTGYQVGKGMLAHLLEVERLKTATPVDTLVPAEPEDVLEEVEQVDVVIEEPDNYLKTAFEHEVVSEEIEAPAPRRMQFQFEDDNA